MYSFHYKLLPLIIPGSLELFMLVVLTFMKYYYSNKKAKNINFKNIAVLITGADKGLVKACALAMAEAGAHVFALSRTLKDLNNLEKVHLKNPKEVYYEIYKEAKSKAKQAKLYALNAIFEANQIKKTYNLDDFAESSDDETSEFN